MDATGSMKYYDFSVQSRGLDPEHFDTFSKVFSHGNGHLGVCGFGAEDLKKDSCPRCIYIAGLKQSSQDDSPLLNTPDFLSTAIYLNGEHIHPTHTGVSNFWQTLSFRTGVVQRKYTFTSVEGGHVALTIERFVSMANFHLCGLRIRIHSINCNGLITVETGIDADACSKPAKDPLKTTADPFDSPEIVTRVNGGRLLVQAAETGRCICEGYVITASGASYVCDSFYCRKTVASQISCLMHPGDAIVIDKLIAVHTSSANTQDLRAKTDASLNEALQLGYNQMLEQHNAAWRNMWDLDHVRLIGRHTPQATLRHINYCYSQKHAPRLNSEHLHLYMPFEKNLFLDYQAIRSQLSNP